MVVALVSALPSWSDFSTPAIKDSNMVHGLLLMATALMRGLLGLMRATCGKSMEVNLVLKSIRSSLTFFIV